MRRRKKPARNDGGAAGRSEKSYKGRDRERNQQAAQYGGGQHGSLSLVKLENHGESEHAAPTQVCAIAHGAKARLLNAARACPLGDFRR
jgi:hypothetical protein